MLRLIALSLVFAFGTVSYGNSPKVHRKTMENGLDVVVFESHKVPLVTIVLVSKAGGMTERPETNGLTHLWEHMFFKANANLPNQEAFDRRIRQLGVILNGDTSAEKVRYYFTMPSVHAPDGLQMMADAIMTPKLEQKELARERKVVMDEYDRWASQPGFVLRNTMQKLLYGEFHYKRDPLGERALIAKASRKQLLQIKDEVFVPSNSALIIGGDIDPATGFKIVSEKFKAWQNPKDWKPIPPPKFPSFPETTRVIATNKTVQTPTYKVTFAGPAIIDNPKDSYALDFLIFLLNLRTGKFYEEFIDSGMTVSSGLGYHTQRYISQVTLYSRVPAKNLKKVMMELKKQPKNWLKKSYFSDQEIETVKNSLKVDKIYKFNKPSAYTRNLATAWAITGLDYEKTYLDELSRLSRADIDRVIRRYLNEQPYIESVLLSPSDADKLGFTDNTKTVLENVKRQGV